MLGGSIPPLVAGLTALLILVIVRVIFRLEGLRTYVEEVPMFGNQNQNAVIRSVLDTIWAVGVGYLTGVLPT